MLASLETKLRLVRGFAPKPLVKGCYATKNKLRLLRRNLRFLRNHLPLSWLLATPQQPKPVRYAHDGRVVVVLLEVLRTLFFHAPMVELPHNLRSLVPRLLRLLSRVLSFNNNLPRLRSSASSGCCFTRYTTSSRDGASPIGLRPSTTTSFVPQLVVVVGCVGSLRSLAPFPTAHVPFTRNYKTIILASLVF